MLTPEAGREDSFLIIGGVTVLTVLFFALFLGGFIWLNRRISRRLWAPFYQTLEIIKSFDLNSHTTVQFQPSNIVEFEELNMSINKLLESNIAVFRQQKEFTENASHELQTPLAIIKSKLDVLLQNEAITPEQSALMEEINHALSRVSRINKNLLLLAKLENQQFLDKQSIELSAPLQEILQLLSGLIAERSVKFEKTEICKVEANGMLLEIMLTNLLMNAIRHTTPNAEIKILLTKTQLSITNTGQYALDSGKIFKRFSTASQQTPGTGLGLSIVKEICNRYAWKISYQFASAQHTFTIIFD